MSRVLESEWEQRLLDRLRAGDRSALTELVRRLHPVLVRTVTRAFADRDLAADAAQSAWLAVLRDLHTFRGDSSLRAWLVAIALNCARALRCREARFLSASAEGRLAGGGCGDLTPERQLLEAEVGRRFEHAILRLSPRMRTLLTLRDLRGTSASDACRALGMSDLAQRVCLSRARAQVRRALNEDPEFAQRCA